jgi:hypothetical protein
MGGRTVTPATPIDLAHLADVARRAREEGDHEMERMAAEALAEAHEAMRLRGVALRQVRRWKDAGFAEVMRREGVARCA